MYYFSNFLILHLETVLDASRKDIGGSWLKQTYFSISNCTWSLRFTEFQKLFPKEVKYLPEIFQVPVFVKTGNIGETDGEL